MLVLDGPVPLDIQSERLVQQAIGFWRARTVLGDRPRLSTIVETPTPILVVERGSSWSRGATPSCWAGAYRSWGDLAQAARQENRR